MMEEHLKFTIWALNLVNMWPDKKPNSVIKQYYIICIIPLSIIPVLTDLILQFYDVTILMEKMIENLIALSALYGVTYILICFMQKKYEIKTLVDDLSIFSKYSPKSLIRQTDQSTEFYTKLFIIYGIFGNIGYCLLPFLTYSECMENRSIHMETYGIGCGLIVQFPLPIRGDNTPVFQLIVIEQITVCSVATTIFLMVTMLFCGILLHTTTHLKYLRRLIANLSTTVDYKLEEEVGFCIQFHNEILKYSGRVNKCFSSIMLIHITITGFIISLLCFEIILLKNVLDSSRFILHLFGWFGVSYLVCRYGQTLIDESFAVSTAIYSINWYEKPVKVQKNLAFMMLRSQRPLVITAAQLKVMSLTTFLGVLYTAYSYFTLLLKLRK